MSVSSSSPLYFVGTYAASGGAGLVPLLLGADGWICGDADDAARNASFGTWSTRFGIHYLVNEVSDGSVGAFKQTAQGWHCLGQANTRGKEPCYAALAPDQAWLAVANYGSGSIALLALDPATGVPQEPVLVRQNSGSGPVADRQEGPHAHCAIFAPDGRWLLHVDLGADEILTYPFDAARGELGERQVAYRARPGTGPRHLAFHPTEPLALLVSELGAQLTLLDAKAGAFRARQTVATLPPGVSAPANLGGHLALNARGDRVYVTNRGHDSICVFALEEGRLEWLQAVSSGGASPRFFLLDEEAGRLVLANEQGCNVAIFDLAEDGRLKGPQAVLPVPGAAFVLRTHGSEGLSNSSKTEEAEWHAA